jgi:protease-4
VWTGLDAQGRGLVDDLGGLDRAVTIAANRAGLDRADVDAKPLPRPNLLERVRPAENSDHVGATAGLVRGLTGLTGGFGAWGAPGRDGGAGLDDLEARLLVGLGLAPYGVLSLPVVWRLR